MTKISAEAQAFAEKAVDLDERFARVLGMARSASTQSQWSKAACLLETAKSLLEDMAKVEADAHEAMLRAAERIVHGQAAGCSPEDGGKGI